MVLHEKPTKNLKLRGLKLRGLTQNQVSTPNYIYQNDQHKKIYSFGYTPTPTQFQNFGKILKIEFPGNWTKTWNVSKLFHSCYSLQGVVRLQIFTFRALADADILDISNKAGSSMRNDDVAMVLNGSFGPTHRLDLKIYWTLVVYKS